MARMKAIDYRVRVGTATYRSKAKPLRWIMAWRRAHMLGGHEPLRAYARSKGLAHTQHLKERHLLSYIKAQGG